MVISYSNSLYALSYSDNIDVVDDTLTNDTLFQEVQEYGTSYRFDFDSAHKKISDLNKKIKEQKKRVSSEKKTLNKLQKQLSDQQKEIKNAKKLIKKANSVIINM